MMFEYKVRCKHKLGWKETKLYADTDIEEFFNRNMTDTVEVKRINNLRVGVDSAICIEVLKYIIKDVYFSIHHELQYDEDSWNPEYYRKLLIGLLSDYEYRLSKGVVNMACGRKGGKKR